MQFIFSPAIQLSNLLSFKAKFVLVSLLCVAPLLFFFATLSQQQWQIVENANYEHNASRFIVPLRNLTEHVAQTRGMTNVLLNGDQSIQNKIVQKRQQVEQDFKSLLAIDSELNTTLITNGVPGSLYNRWVEISQSAFDGKAKQVFTQYTLLISDILNFMDTIGRQGRMMQDSDPANSYLINSLLHTIPSQVESLGKLRGKGAGVLSANSLTIENKLQVAALADNKNAIKLSKDIKYLFTEAPELSSLLSETYTEADKKLKEYLALANAEIVQVESATINANDFFGQGSETISSLLSLFDKMQLVLENRMNSQIAAAKTNIYLYIALIIIVLALLIYAYVGIYLAIKLNLNIMMKSANRICEGDLNTRLELETKDELQLIAVSVNEIVKGLSRSIIAVRNSSNEIALAAQHVASGSSQAAQGMETQSNELAQTSTAITQMSASICEVAQNTEQGSVAAEQANNEAENGEKVVQETIAAINTLANNINLAAAGTETLKVNSNSITNILDVIRGIAEQTNLLALNAAIEAARAGEQGRGFAVVADEVRTLAGRTQNATIEIQQMIELIQSGIEEVADAMTSSQSHAENAVEHSQQSGSVLATITGAVNEITNISCQIAASVEEQSVVAEQVSKSIVNISDVANEASQGAKSLSETGSTLAAMSQEMHLIIERYQLDEEKFNLQEKSLKLLSWQPENNIGIDEADRQHKKMLDMMNEVHILSAQNYSIDSISQALDVLISYTEVHFDWEEKFFDSYQYPKSKEHKNHHAKLIDELRNHQKNISLGEPEKIDKELSFLNDWLINHIQNGDRDYASFLNNNDNYQNTKGNNTNVVSIATKKPLRQA
jgi:methyl-accepting chemotaxis protein